MKIKIYIVTYKGHNRINKTLKSLFESDIDLYPHQIFIINNHSDIRLSPDYMYKVTVLENSTRPDFSTGHLSRNWNEGIVNGFQDVNNPDCDIVINTQDDVLYRTDCFSKLEKLHEKYDLVQNGQGDTFISYNINAIKSIGLWDERFCNISYQASDYFNRCKIYHGSKCSINDKYHNRFLNPIVPGNPNESAGYLIKPDAREIDVQWRQYDWDKEYSRKFFELKWGGKNWKDNDLNIEIDSYITYPYFEKDLDLSDKKYFGYK